MHYFNVVSIGDKVNLSKENTTAYTTQTKQYVSQVLDLVEDNIAIVSMPMEGGRVIPLPVGDKYEGFFYTSKGMFKCQVEVTDRYKDGNMYVMVIQFLSEFEKYQRRQYFRLDLLKNINFRLITPQEDIIRKKVEEDKFDSEITRHKYVNTLHALEVAWNEGTATDISGGGMRFNAQVPKTNEESVIVKIDFSVTGKEYSYELKADIIATSSMVNKPGYYEYRVKFTDIGKVERENLIKYIFEEERKRRKK